MRKCTWFLHLDLVVRGRCVSSQSLSMASSRLADSGLLSSLLTAIEGVFLMRSHVPLEVWLC